jgi:hypothetical protein
MTAIYGISNFPSIIYKPYFTKNKAHNANALKQPKATKVYISVERNCL